MIRTWHKSWEEAVYQNDWELIREATKKPTIAFDMMLPPPCFTVGMVLSARLSKIYLVPDHRKWIYMVSKSVNVRPLSMNTLATGWLWPWGMENKACWGIGSWAPVMMSSSSTPRSLFCSISVTFVFVLKRQRQANEEKYTVLINTIAFFHDSLLLFLLRFPSCFLIRVLIYHIAVQHQVSLIAVLIWPITACQHPQMDQSTKNCISPHIQWRNAILWFESHRLSQLSSSFSSSAAGFQAARELNGLGFLIVSDWPDLPFQSPHLLKRKSHISVYTRCTLLQQEIHILSS